jgi:peptide/nickel transport system permease protein
MTTQTQTQTQTSSAWKRFRSQKRSLLGLILVAAILLFALFAPSLATHDAMTSHFDTGCDALGNPVAPNREFLLGTDLIFRDQLSTLLGGVLGMVGGYFEGRRGFPIPWLALALFILFLVNGHSAALALLVLLLVLSIPAVAKLLPQVVRTTLLGKVRVNADSVLGVSIDVGLSFPFLLLVLAIGAAFEKATMFTILLTLGLTGWMGIARIVRAKTLEVRRRDFVTASLGLGQSTARILAKHILPNVSGPLFAIATLSVGPMIVAESVLSYLGVGISPPEPTWGHMLLEGQELLQSAPWLFFAPASMIVLSALGFNLLGEGLRDAYSERLR